MYKMWLQCDVKLSKKYIMYTSYMVIKCMFNKIQSYLKKTLNTMVKKLFKWFFIFSLKTISFLKVFY